MVKHRITFAAGSGRPVKLLLALAALALAPAAAAQGETTPLFSADTPLPVTLSGPIRELVRKAESSTDPFPTTLAANGETHAIQLAARGNSRRKRETCQFPPLMVDFDDKPGDASLFDKQNRIKLVTHCRDNDNYARIALREYAVYRLYNVLTPKSLKVRLAQVSYMDGNSAVANRMGFFIEDIDDAARRLGKKEAEVERISNAALDADDAARYVLFQYMIGNLDWDMGRGPDGSDCCHNSKLLGASAEAREALVPIPYDFDFSGLVDAPYSAPPPSIRVKSVRDRHYRGMCRHNAEVLRAAPDFLAARPRLEAELRAIPELDPKDRDGMIKYIGDFFKDIATPAAVEKNLLKDCRGSPA